MKKGILISLSLMAILTVWGMAVAVNAATFNVDTTTDNTNQGCLDATPNDCSLRGAISKANSTSGNDIINVPAGIYTLLLTGSGEDSNSTGDLDINPTVGADQLTIQGDGISTTIIRGSGDRVFHINQ